MDKLSFLIFIENSFVPRSEKTKSVYHLVLLLARELFIKGSSVRNEQVSGVGCHVSKHRTED